MRVLLVSTYELGHQPLHVAAPAGRLAARGHEVAALDLSVQAWDDRLVDWADAVALSVPMHTAMRLALVACERIRRARPTLPVALHGLYAHVAAARTVGDGLVDCAIAGEYEGELADWVDRLAAHGGRADGPRPARGGLRTSLAVGDASLPDRSVLPGLDGYARLRGADGVERTAGYVEATRGCAHLCRHCPVPAVYDGRVRLVERNTVLADVDQQVAAGARHVTFGDPDFLNGWRHALRVLRSAHDRHPQVTWDVTVKVEHVLRHRHLWPELAALGVAFVVTAVECLDDRVLGILDKGHTAAQAAEAVEVLRACGVQPRPTWLPFTPWATPSDVADVVEFVAAHDLVEAVDPVQYGIRLLVPDGSLLLDAPELRPHLRGYDPEALSWRWEAADPAADRLQRRVAAITAEAAEQGWPTATTFDRVAEVVADAAGREPVRAPAGRRAAPGLTEPWFCCAEPTDGQLAGVRPAGRCAPSTG